MVYKIHEVARLSGVSVRTLHHYDSIGLLTPALREENGYRLYSREDLDTLQQILFFKELDFELSAIKELLKHPDYDRLRTLRLHRNLLREKMKRLGRILGTVEEMLCEGKEGYTVEDKQKFEVFDMSQIEEHKKKYEQETKEKYGQTDAYKESQRKTSKYTKEDWQRITERGNEIYAAIASLMDRDPGDPEVQGWADAWRQHITDNFYNCSPEMMVGLADLYIQDERFTKNIDKTKPGLAVYLNKAMHIYCDNLKKK